MAPFQLRDMIPDWLRRWRRRTRERRSVRRGNRPTTPEAADASFGALIDDRKRWLFETLPRAAAEVHWDIVTKNSQKQLARRLGIEVAHDFASVVTLDTAFERIEELHLDRFIIKPNSASGARACRPLVRDGDRFRDLRTGRRWRPSPLERALRHEHGRERADTWIVEELLLPVDGGLRPIEDYKLYCFGGTVELILHKRALPGPKAYRAQHHDRDWVPVNVGLDDHDDPIAAAPINGKQIVDTASGSPRSCAIPSSRST